MKQKNVPHNQRIKQSIEAEKQTTQVSKIADKDFKNNHYKYVKEFREKDKVREELEYLQKINDNLKENQIETVRLKNI